MALCACVLVLPGTISVALANTDQGSGWVLQMGAFAQRDNALNLQQTLQSLGYEAHIVTMGSAKERRFKVFTGQAATPEGLNGLRNQLQQQTGTLGFVTVNPVAEGLETLDQEQPDDGSKGLSRPAVLLAQVGDVPAGGESVGSNPGHGYKPATFQTPEQEIASTAGFTLGDLQIVPTVGLALGYNDNITAAHQDEISSWFYLVSPAILAELPTDHSVLSFIASYDWQRYEDSPVDDTDSWYVRANWMWDISARQALNLFAGYTEDYDERGDGRRQGDVGLIPLEPDHWKRFDYGGQWAYGAVGSRGQLTLQAGGSDLTYTNNREGIIPGEPGTAALDRNWWYWGGSFFWRVAPKTSLVATYVHTDISYQESVESDSKEDSFLLGVDWDATARTSGRLQYGWQEKNFADPTVESYDGPTWLASVSWLPRTYSMVTLTGTRNAQEPDGNGEYVIRQDLILSWTHDWATRFNTFVNLGYGQDDYRPDGRTDDRFFWGIGAYYIFNDHFRFGGSINTYSRNSDEEQYSYDQTVYLLTLEASY